mmetsp:Transcript_19359/g.47851  ORF Transcript_19359/g.47851 Transcript_19359/m.47851 type:complete len:445 (-) Transcript_19359:271-1605(-)
MRSINSKWNSTKKKYILHKRGNDAKQFLTFWEYVDIVNKVLHEDSTVYNVGTPSADMTLEQHKAEQAKEEEKRKAAKGTLARNSGYFNIYSYFEAFLLRRLHIAMILKHQRAKQSDVWNDVIMSLYNIMPGMKKRNKAANEKYITLKPESNETMRQMIKLQKKKMRLYEKMIETLKEEVEEEQMASSLDDDKALVDNDTNEESSSPTKPPSTVDTSLDADLNTAKFYQKGRYDGGGDDDEMSFKSFSSRKSNRSKRRTSNKPTNASAQAPRWMKSSRSKLSKSANRDVLGDSFRSNRSNRSNRSPSPGGRASPSAGSAPGSPMGSPNPSNSAEAAPITDDDIERFLYPNKPIRKSGGGVRHNNSKQTGANAPRESLPSELKFDQDGTGGSIVSALHDDASVGSGSKDGPQTLSAIKAKKKELDSLIKSMETPGEEGEDNMSNIE